MFALTDQTPPGRLRSIEGADRSGRGTCSDVRPLNTPLGRAGGGRCSFDHEQRRGWSTESWKQASKEGRYYKKYREFIEFLNS